jgi:formate hydrogenlyase subunit 3/multisubunit Na+/H+ antiporter MnhD subunit
MYINVPKLCRNSVTNARTHTQTDKKKAARCTGETLADLKVLLGIGSSFGCKLDVGTSSVICSISSAEVTVLVSIGGIIVGHKEYHLCFLLGMGSMEGTYVHKNSFLFFFVICTGPT